MALPVEHTGGGAGDQEPVDAQLRGEVPGQGIGIDVQERAVSGDANAGDHRHVPEGREVVKQDDRAAVGVADEPEIDAAPRRSLEGRCPPGTSDAAVGAGQAYGGHAGSMERANECGVRAAGKHRHDGVERRLVGDPQPVHEPRLEPAPAKLRVDRTAAAVDDDHAPAPLEQADGPRHPAHRRRVVEQLPPEFQHSRHDVNPAQASRRSHMPR
jgi:hypothetical protein